MDNGNEANDLELIREGSSGAVWMSRFIGHLLFFIFIFRTA